LKPINLNKARKARDRAESRARADQNAIKFGRNKAEKAADTVEAAKTRRTLDNAKRDP